MKNFRQKLGLQSHPEGGAFRELYKSPREVTTDSGEKRRAAMTHIYFHLVAGEVSRFHKVLSDEIWHLYEGEGVTLYQWQEGGDEIERIELGSEETPHCHLIPAGFWQAAEPRGQSVLVGCSVAPGFEFEDFSLIDPQGAESKAIRAIDPKLERFL